MCMPATHSTHTWILWVCVTSRSNRATEVWRLPKETRVQRVCLCMSNVLHSGSFLFLSFKFIFRFKAAGKTDTRPNLLILFNVCNARRINWIKCCHYVQKNFILQHIYDMLRFVRNPIGIHFKLMFNRFRNFRIDSVQLRSYCFHKKYEKTQLAMLICRGREMRISQYCGQPESVEKCIFSLKRWIRAHWSIRSR